METGPVITVPSVLSPADALTALDQACIDYAVVLHEELPQSTLHRTEFTALRDISLADQLEALPALVILGVADELDLDDLADLAWLLDRGGSSAVTLIDDDVVVGVISADELDLALPIEAVRTVRMSGDPGVPARWYVCSRCRPVPTRRAPLIDSETPRCPRNWLHGAMDPEK
jgi:hypothetical protein